MGEKFSKKRFLEKNQANILEMSWIYEIKNAVKSLSDRLDQAEEKIYELEDRSYKISQSDKKKKKKKRRTGRGKRRKWASQTFGMPLNKWNTHTVLEYPKARKNVKAIQWNNKGKLP